MSVKVIIPFDLGHYTDGILKFDLQGSTVGEILHNISQRFPRLDDILFTHDGQLDEFFHIVLNKHVLSPADSPLTNQVCDGDEIYIIVPLAGG